MIRVIRNLSPSDPVLGISLEEALLETAKKEGSDTLRLWVNDRAVVIGRSQVAEDEVDLYLAHRLRVPVIRRISGGGAVYHYPGNLNISLYLSDGRRLGGVRDTFQQMGETIAISLQKHEINVEPVGSSLMLNGRKIGGAAQARRGTALLYHTTLLVHPTSIAMEQLLCALRPDYHTRGVPSHPHPTASIHEIIGREIPLGEFAQTIEAEVTSFLGRKPVRGEVGENEARRAQELTQKNRAYQWNRQR